MRWKGSQSETENPEFSGPPAGLKVHISASWSSSPDVTFIPAATDIKVLNLGNFFFYRGRICQSSFKAYWDGLYELCQYLSLAAAEPSFDYNTIQIPAPHRHCADKQEVTELTKTAVQLHATIWVYLRSHLVKCAQVRTDKMNAYLYKQTQICRCMFS